MEDHIILYEGIFKPAVTFNSVVFFSTIRIVSALKVMDFRQNAGCIFKTVMLRYTGSDVVEKIDKMNPLSGAKPLIDFTEITAVNKKADGVYCWT